MTPRCRRQRCCGRAYRRRSGLRGRRRRGRGRRESHKPSSRTQPSRGKRRPAQNKRTENYPHFPPQVASMYFIWNAARPPVSGVGDKMLTHNEYDVGFELVELHLCLSICLDQEERRNPLVFESSCHLTTTHGGFTLSLILPNVKKGSSYCPLDCGPWE